MREFITYISFSLFSIFTVSIASGTTLVSNSFDGSPATGPAFHEVSNRLGKHGFSDPATGVIVSGKNSNSSYALHTTNTVDVTSVLGSTGFTVEYVVSSASNLSAITRNGWFFGVASNADVNGTDGNSLWNTNPDSLGVVLLSSNHGNMKVVQDGFDTSAAVESLETPRPDEASLEDGFSIYLTVNNDNTWFASSKGLIPDFSANGFLGPYFNYYDIADNLTVVASIQGNKTKFTLDSINMTTVTIPEPLAYALLSSAFGFALLLRRSRMGRTQ